MVKASEYNQSSLSLLHELIPNVDSVAFLVNPSNAVAELDASDVQAAAGALGQKLIIVNAGTEVEIVAAFMTIAGQRVGELGQQY
jgi:putative tryptophan/tyrosine transport system substrate-binding protein